MVSEIFGEQTNSSIVDVLYALQNTEWRICINGKAIEVAYMQVAGKS